MAQDKVITGPMAIIRVDGVPVGKMKNIRVTESFRRGKVTGLGQLFADELPVLDFDGTFSCSFYNIDLRKSMIPGAINRAVQDTEQATAMLLLQEVGIQVDILKRVKTGVQNGVPTYKLVIYATIKYAFLTRESYDISEGQISGRDTDFQFTEMTTFPI